MANAVNAALEDPRFQPMTSGELDEVEVEISALTPMREVAGPDEIVLGRHGVLLKKGRHSAVYLPQVASQQGWNLEQTLNHLARKAGLPTNGWREGATFEVFEATVFPEHAL
jgi:AmmeMemoRadiSam system protein A